MKNKKIFVILMTYGSPKSLSLKNVTAYLKNVYGGKDPTRENAKEFLRRYKLIGGSPLIQITQAQAQALEKELNDKLKNICVFVVNAGMRFSHPYIEEVVATNALNADGIVGIIMSPQYSPIIMKGYVEELTEAVSKLNNKVIKLKIAQDWHLQPFFLQALAKRVQEAIKLMPKSIQQKVPVLFSAHSMPKRVIDKEPGYIDDLKETATQVAKLAGIPKSRWQFCYQSAGHTPEEWLKPDFADLIPKLAKKGHKHVLIAPVQFLSDHLEILYDVDIGAREQAEKYGVKFYRTQSLNISPLFIKSLAEVTLACITQ